MAEVKLNISIVEQTCVAAFQDACYLLNREFTKAISEPGAFDGFDGDIVDTGQLRASQQLEFRTPIEARFTWNTEYAVYVKEGYTLRNGKEIKGRDWVALGLERLDFQGTYQQFLQQRLGG